MELNGVESEDFVAYCMELTGICATINNAVETFIYLDKSISTKKVGVSIMTLSTFETVLHHMYLVSTAAAILDTVNLSNMMENMLNIKLLIMGDFKIPVVVLCIADNTGNTNNGNTNANTERSLWLAISFDDGKHDANNSTSGDSKELRIIECTAYSVVNEKLVSKKEVDINNVLDLEVRTQLLHAVEMAKVWASSGTDQFTKLN